MKFGTLKQGAASALIAAGCALALGSGAALAESACKGLEQGACEKAAECIWVGGYEKKDGKQVSGYCRTKSGGGVAGDKKGEKDAGAKTPAKPATKTGGAGDTDGCQGPGDALGCDRRRQDPACRRPQRPRTDKGKVKTPSPGSSPWVGRQVGAACAVAGPPLG